MEVNTTYGQWSVIEEIQPKKNHRQMLCKCSCGTVKVVALCNLKSGKSTRCGKCYGKSISKSNHYNWRGVGVIPGTYLNQINISAESRGLLVSVTPEYLNSIFDGTCALSGLKISFEESTASLDRIDSTLGYVVGNVQWVHKDINIMKNKYTQDYFVYLCSKVKEKYDRN